MDFWGFVLFFFLAFLIMSCCGYCCSSKKRGAVLSTPVVVTSATHTAPGGYVTQMPVPATGYQTNVYTAAPYPTQMNNTAQMPMPMPMPGTQPPPAGVQPYPYMAPYPPMAAPASAAANMNPPTYDMAVAQPANAVYEKQSAYNPNFSAH